MCHIVFVPSVNIRQLRETRKLKAWLRAGETIELRERDRVIARIVPSVTPSTIQPLPDFERLRKQMFGDRTLSGVDLLVQERGRD